MEKLDSKAKTWGGRYYKIKKISGFTLVELIIVITILVILTTIAFLNFGNFGSQARDTVRISDFEIIKKSLELYKAENGEYPDPDSTEEKYLNPDNHIGFEEGIIGENLGGKLKLGKVPKNPSNGKYYNYMVSDDRGTYLMKVELENGDSLIVGDIATGCSDLHKKGKLTESGYYNIYHNKLKPRKIYCDKNEDIDFYDFVLGGDIEPLYGENPDSIKEYGFELGNNSVISSEKNTTPGGKYSIKVTGGGKDIIGKNFTLVDSTKKYKISGKFFLERINNNTDISKTYLGFIEYDKDKKIIYPGRVNIVLDTETYLTRDINLSEKKIYFHCDDTMYNRWRNTLWYGNLIAYDIEDNLGDLPTKELSSTIGNYSKKDLNYKNFIEKIGENECSLKTLDTFSFPKKKNTRIRLHRSGSTYNYGGGSLNINTQHGKWIEFSGIVNGESESGINELYFRKGTKYIKPLIIVNYWLRNENGIRKSSNNNTITYIDDIKIEVIE